MNWKKEKFENMKKANTSLLKEDHEHSDSGKMEYIKKALKNLSSDDLDKIYLSVEKYDPEYENKNPKLPNTGSQVDDSEEYYNTHDKYGNLNYDSRYSK